MKHIEVSLLCVGDTLTAIGIALELSKTLKETVYLDFRSGVRLSVSPQSNALDLSQIMRLEEEILKLKKYTS